MCQNSCIPGVPCCIFVFQAEDDFKKQEKIFLFIDILFVTIRNQCQSDKSVFKKKFVLFAFYVKIQMF